MLIGRLGLETARVPHADRHGLIWLERGKLTVEDGVLTFTTAGSSDLKPGVYQIPLQNISNVLLGPGGVVSHDALRLLARQGTGLVAVGQGGVRLYASMPFGPDSSDIARAQTRLWADETSRAEVVRRMYALRLDEPNPRHDLNTLRGIEGVRMKEVYRRLAKLYGVTWKGRRYDRANPDSDDLINTAINHASTAVRAAALVAVALTGAIPQLGFIHEASGQAFALDIADLYRVSFLLPVAFEATRSHRPDRGDNIERATRKLAGERMRRQGLIPSMIDSVKEVLDVHGDGGDA